MRFFIGDNINWPDSKWGDIIIAIGWVVGSMSDIFWAGEGVREE